MRPASRRRVTARLREHAVYASTAIIVGVSWVLLVTERSLPGDRELSEHIHERGLPGWERSIAEGLDALGDPLPATVATLAVAAVIAVRDSRRAGWFALSTVGVVAITTAIKLLVERERPTLGLGLDPSFPSGHTAFATSVFGYLAVVEFRARHWFIAGFAAGVVIAMGPSRVLLGVHWASDVVAGYFIGATWLVFVLRLARRQPDREP